jgi:hypothetical protein
MIPNTLNFTQSAVGRLRQTISFRTASARKKKPQRQVSLRQPSSRRSNAAEKTYFTKSRPKANPPSSVKPKKA